MTLAMGALLVGGIAFGASAGDAAASTTHESPSVRLVASDDPNGCGVYGALCDLSKMSGDAVQAVGNATTKCVEEATAGAVGEVLGKEGGSKWKRLKNAAKNLGKRAGAPAAALSCAHELGRG